jgi:hypothetical protein
MATKPLPPGTENLTVNLPRGFKVRLRQQAELSVVTLSKYVRTVLEQAVKENVLVAVRKEEVYTLRQPSNQLVAENPPPEEPRKKNGTSAEK